MSDELVEYVDEAGKAFASDVEMLVAEYRAKMKDIASAKDEALEESERARSEAEVAYEAAKAEAVQECAEGIRKAAKKRASESQHPEHIHEACANIVRPIETIGSTIEPSEIVRMIGRSEKWRREGEEAAVRKQRRMGLVWGIGYRA